MAVELPVLSGDPVCPAALAIRGTCRAEQGVICRVMQADAEGDAGLRMTPRALEVARDSGGGVYLNVKTDPSTVTGFCYGNALGRSTESDEGPRAHFTFCPVWEAWDERRRAGKDGLYDVQEPEPVSMGMSSLDADDPWERARRDLDELAPPEAA